jgi:hypothetical protein
MYQAEPMPRNKATAKVPKKKPSARMYVLPSSRQRLLR